MYRYILLCLLFAQIQAADDKSIGAMMQRLRAVEQTSQGKNEGRFVYREGDGGSRPLPEGWRIRVHGLLLDGIRGVMQDNNALPEVDYFRKLGASEQLSDEQKLSEQMVRTPFFDQLAHKQQEEKDTVLKGLLEMTNDLVYPVGRLLFVASLYAGASANVLKGKRFDLLKKVLVHDDTSLVDLALQKGADPNSHNLGGWSVLSYCQSIEAANLMVKHGANVAEAFWCSKDLVWHACATRKAQLLPFYLTYVPLSESNKFGRAWMQAISDELDSSVAIEPVEILLEYGCEYDEETKQKICAYVAQDLPKSKERIENAFANAETKNIKKAKK